MIARGARSSRLGFFWCILLGEAVYCVFVAPGPRATWSTRDPRTRLTIEARGGRGESWKLRACDYSLSTKRSLVKLHSGN